MAHSSTTTAFASMCPPTRYIVGRGAAAIADWTGKVEVRVNEQGYN